MGEPVIDMVETEPGFWQEACGNVVQAPDGPAMECPGHRVDGRCIYEQHHYRREG